MNPTRRRGATTGSLALVLLFACAVQAQTCLRTVPVSTSSGLSAAVAGALPGDCIVLANGNYSAFTITSSGTAANPITLSAANEGGATITSGFVRFSGVSRVTLQGLKITTSGGTLTVDGVSRKVGVVLTDCNNCRITRCKFNLTGQSSGTEWVFLGGNSNSNRIDHCEFGALTVNGRYIFPCGNATIAGVTPNPTVDRGPWAHGLGPSNPNMSRYTQIDHNYFHDHSSATTNAISESIVLGGIGMTGDYQGTGSTVEYNLFVNCDGDGAEIISTKSSTNTLRYNTVVTSAGHFSLRSGNGSSVYGNFFLQGGKANTGGIKLSEMDHRIYNNYIENTVGGSYPIMFENGDYYTNSSFSHAQVMRCWTVHNTVVNPGRQVLIGHNSGSPLKPTDCVFANNIIKGTLSTLYSEDQPTNLVRSQNIIWTQNPGKSGFIVTDPQLNTVNGIQKLSSGSPAINAADKNYDAFVTDDMDGQARDGAPDIGADEFSSATVLRQPLTTNDVGPNAFDSDFELSAGPISQVAVPGTNVSCAINVNALDSFTGSVSLAVGGLPPNTSGVFTPAFVNGSGSSTLSVTVSNLAQRGSSTLTITGASASTTNTTTTTLIVGRNPANLKWTSPSGSTWDIGATSNWFNLDASVSDVFYTGDGVLLDDTVSVQTNVTLGIAVAPAAITNDSSANNFTIGGTGKITGVTGLIKKGASTLTLNTVNDFTGAVTVQGGTLKTGNSSALGSAGNGAIIAGGATLDVAANSVNLGSEPITAAGFGVNSNGAIINSSGSGSFSGPNVAYVSLTGDTAIGGTGRLDWRSNPATGTNAALNSGGNPYALIKLGTNQLQMAGVVVDPALGDIEVRGGILGIQGWTTLGDPAHTLTVFSNATLHFFQVSNVLNKLLVLQDGAIVNNNSGSNTFGGPVLLQGSNIFNVGGAGLTLTNVIVGGGTLAKVIGSGPLFLSSANAYSGSTWVGAGTLALVGSGSISVSSNIIIGAGAILDVSGRVDGTLTLAGGQVLQGNGILNGSLTAGLGATVSPGSSIGKLTVTSAVTLQGETLMELDRLNGTNDVIQGAVAINYGGTLVVTNINGTLAAGDRFQLFYASSCAGTFTDVVPPVPGPGLLWDLSGLTNGVLKVVPPPQLQIDAVTVAGTNLVFQGINGVTNGTFYLLASTNIILTLTNWTVVATNAFDANGNFNFSHPLDPAYRYRYFVLQLP